MTLPRVMDRIRGATPYSQIAVFRSGQRGCLEAVFADTILTRLRIARQDEAFIGIYDGSMDVDAIHKHLSLCARHRA